MDPESLGWLLAAALSWWTSAVASGIRHALVQLEDTEAAESDYDTLSHLHRLRDDPVGLALRLRLARILPTVLVPTSLVMLALPLGAVFGVLAAALGWLLGMAADVAGGSPAARWLMRFPGGRGLLLWQRFTAPASRLLRPLSALRLREPGPVDAEHTASEGGLAESGIPLGREERRMLRRLLASNAIVVSDIMTRWDGVIAVDADTPPEAMPGVFRSSRHSRLPLVEGGRVLGVIAVKDVLAARLASPMPPPTRLMRAAHFVRREMLVQDLLDELQDEREHLAVVVDSLGRPVGVVTVEDVLEEIVGELYDEREAPR